MDDARLAEMIHQDKVDILFDLSQHSADNRLPVFARRPAPVQASFAGYPAGAGLEAIGYRISDKYLEGGLLSGDSASHERIFLIDSFWCFAPCGINLAVNDLPAKQSGTVTFGCLNNFCKINEPVLALWAQVLRRVKDSRLVILCPPGSQRQGTLKVLARHGVEATRVEFVEPLPRQGYLELYHRLDLVLDTFPYNGHTTSLDALWMGVPVVSLAGESPVSRAGLSQLSNLGLQQFAAQTEEEFVNVATGWAGDQLQLAHLRATLRGRMEASALMDAPRFARQIEDACRQMWRDWCAGHATSMNKIEGPGK